MRGVFLVGFFVVAVSVGQEVRAPARCTGPECAERVKATSPTPPRRAARRAERRVDRFGRPKPSRRAERFRLPVYTPRHKPMERWEAFEPPTQAPRHPNRAERFRLSSPQASRRVLQRAEKYQPPLRRLRLRPYLAEKQRPPRERVAHPQTAERFSFFLPLVRHRPERAEKLTFPPRRLRRQKTPQGTLYALPTPRPKPPRAEGCAPPPLPHPSESLTEKLGCEAPTPRRINFDRYRCQAPHLKHAPRRSENLSCRPTPLPHKNFDRYACQVPSLRHYPARSEKLACQPPAVAHKNFDRYSCPQPTISHRPPQAYEVPCDAQKRGVMTATERLAHDLRYLFTNHRKHCEVAHAYSGFSTGEWVNTRTYGRVPVAGVKMGWRVYVFAHFYDQKGRPLKKPRLEKRKVWAVKQVEVWVAEPAKKSSRRRYIKGLPGVEGFGGLGDSVLVKKRLSVEETKAIQIEKLVRKRQIAWLVRAYPEERVRLSEWLQKYAGPKPPHLWPSLDYRLWEVWGSP
ncbi:MAG: hypothetical protein KatS3mg026_0458 [Bacteroidia bacterium]|nr:MAG: hypothetical protein KatS3mg026_0458 [Bacteroidia bacterium]